MEFDESDPMSVLTGLRNFCDSCNRIKTRKCFATVLLCYYMKKPVFSSLGAPLSSKKLTPTGLSDKTQHSYFNVVNYLVATYATSDIIIGAPKQQKRYLQGPRVLVSHYVEKPYMKALRSGIVYNEKWSSRYSLKGRRRRCAILFISAGVGIH